MKPKIICLYNCPKCEGYMECKITSVFDQKKETWKCVKCKREFNLKFTEVKKNVSRKSN